MLVAVPHGSSQQTSSPPLLTCNRVKGKGIEMRMIRCRDVRLALLATLLIAAAGVPASSYAQTAPAAGAASTSPATAKQVQVDLLRGLADIFSRGMDTLTDKLNRQGYSARVYSTNGWQAVAHRIADKYTRGHKDIIVIIGHSLGANAAFDIANQLDRQNIPIELIVTFDATRPQPAPKNVLHLVNLYQQNGFGEKVSAGPDFKGELTNIDLTADKSLSHTTIEKSPRLHALVMQKIVEIVNKDLANRIAASKPKKKPRKAAPKPS
jgi:thioesterase superfamily protein